MDSAWGRGFCWRPFLTSTGSALSLRSIWKERGASHDPVGGIEPLFNFNLAWKNEDGLPKTSVLKTIYVPVQNCTTVYNVKIEINPTWEVQKIGNRDFRNTPFYRTPFQTCFFAIFYMKKGLSFCYCCSMLSSSILARKMKNFLIKIGNYLCIT